MPFPTDPNAPRTTMNIDPDKIPSHNNLEDAVRAQRLAAMANGRAAQKSPEDVIETFAQEWEKANGATVEEWLYNGRSMAEPDSGYTLRGWRIA